MTKHASPNSMTSDCLFCKIIAGTIPANRVYEDEFCIGFPDIDPRAPTHLLVVPKVHIASLAKTDGEHTLLLGQLVKAATEIARGQRLDQGYRIIINTGDDGGQTVHHLHLHLLGGRAMLWPPG